MDHIYVRWPLSPGRRWVNTWKSTKEISSSAMSTGKSKIDKETKWILENKPQRLFFLSGATFSPLTPNKVYYTQPNTGKTRRTGYFFFQPKNLWNCHLSQNLWKQIKKFPWKLFLAWTFFSHLVDFCNISMQYVSAQFKRWWDEIILEPFYCYWDLFLTF